MSSFCSHSSLLNSAHSVDVFFFSSRRRHTRLVSDWNSDVCSSDLTTNYAHRIGTRSFTNVEFNRVHALGIGAEEELLRDYFGDPTIRIVNDSPNPTVRRAFRNSQIGRASCRERV